MLWSTSSVMESRRECRSALIFGNSRCTWRRDCSIVFKSKREWSIMAPTRLPYAVHRGQSVGDDLWRQADIPQGFVEGLALSEAPPDVLLARGSLALIVILLV